jgi:hypothetical protein
LRNPFHLPGVRMFGRKGFAQNEVGRLGFYPFRGPDAFLTLAVG